MSTEFSSEQQSAYIAKATVNVDITLSDGTERNWHFDLDHEDDHPVIGEVGVEIDWRDVTDLAVDTSRRTELGDRQAVSLSIRGRGPVKASAASR